MNVCYVIKANGRVMFNACYNIIEHNVDRSNPFCGIKWHFLCPKVALFVP
jgi:hypothetical protein